MNVFLKLDILSNKWQNFYVIHSCNVLIYISDTINSFISLNYFSS